MKMANEKKSIIEEALLEAEQIDATFKSNAKEILAQTMSSEIEEMVKESLTGSRKRLKEDEGNVTEEDEELELDTEEEGEESEEMEFDAEEEGEEDMEIDIDTEEGEESEDMDIDIDLGDESEEIDMDLDLGDTEGEEMGSESPEMDTDVETVDLTKVTDNAKVISVFKKMGPEDEIEVVNDNGMVTLKDNKSGSEYRIEMNPAGEVASVEAGELGLGEGTEDSNQVIYEIVVDDEDYMEDEMDYMYDEMDYMEGNMDYADDEMDYAADDTDYIGAAQSEHEGICNQPGYEDHPSCKDHMSMKMDYMSYKKSGLKNPEKADLNKDHDISSYEKKRGMAIEKSMSKNQDEDEMDYMKMPRTYGKASKLPNRKSSDIADNRSKMRYESNTPQITKLIKENTNLNTKLTSIESENTELKDTQEKMVEALKQFRKKLQEVAVFNSNLTYAVRLFTENSTTKEEKQDILKRLDSAKDLKESQLIYKQLVKEFSTSKAPIKESIDEKINKTASSGAQISESSVFVHPELQNMKKLWEYKYKK